MGSRMVKSIYRLCSLHQILCLRVYDSTIHGIGGPGSGKGRTVANLQSMFGMKLISTESIVLKNLPKKLQHVMAIESTDVRCINIVLIN